jgi:hypothetical protein
MVGRIHIVVFGALLLCRGPDDLGREGLRKSWT